MNGPFSISKTWSASISCLLLTSDLRSSSSEIKVQMPWLPSGKSGENKGLSSMRNWWTR